MIIDVWLFEEAEKALENDDIVYLNESFRLVKKNNIVYFINSGNSAVITKANEFGEDSDLKRMIDWVNNSPNRIRTRLELHHNRTTDYIITTNDLSEYTFISEQLASPSPVYRSYFNTATATSAASNYSTQTFSNYNTQISYYRTSNGYINVANLPNWYASATSGN